MNNVSLVLDEKIMKKSAKFASLLKDIVFLGWDYVISIWGITMQQTQKQNEASHTTKHKFLGLSIFIVFEFQYKNPISVYRYLTCNSCAR